MSQKGSGGSKELRIVTKPVVTVEVVKKDPKKLRILHIIQAMKEISERSLTNLVYMLKNEKNVDIGYEFIMIGDTPSSRALAEDIRILLYLGLLETDPTTRRLRLTSTGEEFLEQNKLPEDEAEPLMKAVEELKPRIEAEESTTELLLRGLGRRRRRRFRR